MIRNLFTAVCILVSGFVPLAVQSQNFAREFIENQKDKSKTEVVYVDFVDEILHTNTTLSMMEGFDELDAETKDLLTKKYTLVSDKVNDSILLSVFKTKFLSTLNSFGFDVRECKADSFPQTIQPNEHTLQVAQFELEEFMVNDTIAAKDNNQTISYTKLLSGIRWNTWLKYNTSDTNTCLIFFADDETILCRLHPHEDKPKRCLPIGTLQCRTMRKILLQLPDEQICMAKNLGQSYNVLLHRQTR